MNLTSQVYDENRPNLQTKSGQMARIDRQINKERKKKRKKINRSIEQIRKITAEGVGARLFSTVFPPALRDFPRAVQALRPDDKFRHGSMIN